MDSFTDTNSRVWNIQIDYLSIERVIAETGFNLLALVDPKTAALLDTIKMLGILYSLCGPQLKETGITREQFIKSLDADCVEAAGVALERALINFSPSRLRPTLRKMSEKGQSLQAAAINQANEFMDKVTPEQLLAAGREQMDRILAMGTTSSATNMPESAESIPAPTHSES